MLHGAWDNRALRHPTVQQPQHTPPSRETRFPPFLPQQIPDNRFPEPGADPHRHRHDPARGQIRYVLTDCQGPLA